MILVTDAGNEIGALVVEALRERGVEHRALTGEPDLVALSKELRGVERIFVEEIEPARAVDVLSLAEQYGAYHAVLLTALGEASEATEHVQLSSLRSTVLRASPRANPHDVAAAAARALVEAGDESSTYDF